MENSRDRGYFEVTACSDLKGLTIGLATDDVDRVDPLGHGKGGLGWMWKSSLECVCKMHESLCIISPEVLPEHRYFFGKHIKAVKAPPFKRGDVIGMLVSCISVPMLIFFVNGVREHQIKLEEEVYGKVLFPAFSAGCREHFQFSSNPNFPASHARVCLPDCQIWHLVSRRQIKPWYYN